MDGRELPEMNEGVMKDGASTQQTGDNRAREINTMPIAQLMPWDKNPRHNDDAAKKLASYIERDGWGAPVLVQAGTNRIIAGHTRRKAALLLGMTDVPVRVIPCDDKQATRLALADNKLGQLAQWDDVALLSLLDECGLADAELMGWDSSELDAIAKNMGPGEIEEDEVPEPPSDPVTKSGDVWKLGRHTVVCGDALAVALPLCEIAFTDPPYDMNVQAIASAIAEKSAAIVCTFRQAAELAVCDKLGFYFSFDFVMYTPTPKSFMNRRQPHYTHQTGVYLTRDKKTLFHNDNSKGVRSDDTSKTGYWSTVINSPKNTKAAHGHAKSVTAWVDIMAGFSFTTARDPFLGSGTTLIACEQLDRTCVGTEIDPGYCDVIVDRWESLTGGKATRGTSL